jgi:hypothetical protein
MPGIGFGVKMRTRRPTGCALALAGAFGLPACGQQEDHPNHDRPASSINVTAAIADGRINVSPENFGAGPIRLIVSNQTPSPQALTFETGGGAAGVTQTTAPINPAGVATLEVDVTEGQYEITTDDGAIKPAAVKVGAPRASAQSQLLQP